MRNADGHRALNHSDESAIVLIRKASQGVSGAKGRLGIFPASFNPPTMAHLALIKEARRQGALDEILVLLDVRAMDKSPGGASFEDRLMMLKDLFQRDPTVSIGLSNQGLFVQKLRPLRELYPSPVELTFVVGFDTIVRVMDKKYYRNRRRALDELFSQSRFLVANRDDAEIQAFEIFLGRRENKRYGDKVSFLDLSKKFSSLSSSLIRREIMEGRPVKDMVPAPVMRLIETRGLYRAGRKWPASHDRTGPSSS